MELGQKCVALVSALTLRVCELFFPVQRELMQKGLLERSAKSLLGVCSVVGADKLVGECVCVCVWRGWPEYFLSINNY